MEILKKLFVVAVCGVLSLSANASAVIGPKVECKNNTCENFRVGMYRLKNTVTMNVLLEKSKGERIMIRLMNEKGKVVHQEVVGKAYERYGRKLNFSDAEDGDYVLEISDDNEKIVKNIHLTTNEVKEVQRRSLLTMN